MARKEPKRKRSGERRRKLGKPQLLAQFEQYDDASRFAESVPGSWIVYPASYVKKFNEEVAA